MLDPIPAPVAAFLVVAFLLIFVDVDMAAYTLQIKLENIVMGIASQQRLSILSCLDTDSSRLLPHHRPYRAKQ